MQTISNENTVAPATTGAADFPLGVEGFTYGDLYRPERLRALAENFYDGVLQEDPALHASLIE
ncbi:MAG TPA: hypothetical protein VM934_12085, partial [Pyrinomonadaceae bacterium]|nr:hypothetical protein [Pyrinomonadaceae bacterium]